MRISDTLSVSSILTGTSWPDFEAAVAALVGVLVRAGTLPANLGREAVAAVCSRERMASTAMVDIGVSIPHTRLEGIHGVISALAVSPQPIYGATMGTPISIVALVLSPPALTGEHLNFLSALSLLLHSSAVRQSLQRAVTPAAALDIIRLHERR